MSRQADSKKKQASSGARAVRSRSSPSRPAPHRSGELPKVWTWLGLLIPAALILGAVILGGGEVGDPANVGSPAPDFALPTTLGTEVSLDDAVAEGDALLYFSMGVGCDGCFAQIPEIEVPLRDMGINLVSVMVQPSSPVAETAERFGIHSPILIDEDRSVSTAYEMLGIYGHSDRPSHSFALVGPDQTIKWVKHYSTMFVPLDALVADLGAV